jgi:hypothetical protein
VRASHVGLDFSMLHLGVSCDDLLLVSRALFGRPGLLRFPQR